MFYTSSTLPRLNCVLFISIASSGLTGFSSTLSLSFSLSLSLTIYMFHIYLFLNGSFSKLRNCAAVLYFLSLQTSYLSCRNIDIISIIIDVSYEKP